METDGQILDTYIHTLPMEFDTKHIEQHDVITKTIMLEAHGPFRLCEHA